MSASGLVSFIQILRAALDMSQAAHALIRFHSLKDQAAAVLELHKLTLFNLATASRNLA